MAADPQIPECTTASPHATGRADSRQPYRRQGTISSLAAFGGVGAIAFVVDIGVYNLARSTLLVDSPIWAKVVSVGVATAVAWIGNRTFAFRDSRRGSVAREALLFTVMNVGGLLIAAGCLFVSHYLLGLTSRLADNVSGNVVGLVLGTAFRYIGYRFIVFRPRPAGTASGTGTTPTTGPEAASRPGAAHVEISDGASHPVRARLRTIPGTGGIPRRGYRPHLGVRARSHPSEIGGAR